MLHYGYLEDYISDLRSQGRYSFSLAEVHALFNQSTEAIKKALQRLKQKRKIASVRNGFYVVIPPEYRSKGMLPPSLFIAELMEYLGRDYYIGLLNASVYYAAAHQQPQSYSVIIKNTSLRDVKSDKLQINFYLKKDWVKQDIIQKKVDTGYIHISCAELTALDLVHYQAQVGGLNRVATVLDELSECIDPNKLLDVSMRYGAISTIQRLGYILDSVLDRAELSDPLKNYLHSVAHYPILLKPQLQKPPMNTGNDWKVVPNAEIETDL